MNENDDKPLACLVYAHQSIRGFNVQKLMSVRKPEWLMVSYPIGHGLCQLFMVMTGGWFMLV